MDDTRPGVGGGSKSRSGCSECKRKRVKCDEAKPTCSRCSKHPERCSYALKLSWTQGRPFKKPRMNEPAWMVGQSQATPEEPKPTPSTRPPPIEKPEIDAETFSFVNNTQPEPQDAPTSTSPDSNGTSQTVSPFCQGACSSSTSQASPSSPSSGYLDDDSLLEQPLDQSDGIEDIVRDDNNSLVAYGGSHRPSVPPSLSTYPLICPSESPNAYFFLHHYITHTSGSLFPLVPPVVHQEVLSIAASTPHLLSSALALSCDQYRRLKGVDSPELQKRAMFFSRKAVTGLQAAMDNPTEATSFQTICTVLFLCTNEVMAGNTTAWRTHLRGAEQLLSLALGKHRRENVPMISSQQMFLIRWFALVDTFANIMSLDKRASNDGQYWSLGSPADTSTQYIDDFIGFSLELVPILARIGRMARLQQRRKSSGARLDSGYAEMSDDLDSLLADNVLLTEQQLGLLFSRAASPSLLEAHDPVLAQEAQYTHQMHVHAALLHLYRRVQELPRPDPKPAQVLAALLGTAEHIRPHSPAIVLVLWPLFTAGCEAEDARTRAHVEVCLSRLRTYGWGNVDTALDVLRHYWAEGNGERWDVFLERRGYELVLF